MENRFVNKYHQSKDPKQGPTINRTIIKDEVTGVNYLFIRDQGQKGGAGLTPLLGSDGRPIIEPVEK